VRPRRIRLGGTYTAVSDTATMSTCRCRSTRCVSMRILYPISPINVERLPSQPDHLKGANESGSSNQHATVNLPSRFSPQPSDQSDFFSLVQFWKDSMTGGTFYVRGPTVRGRQVRSFGRFILMSTDER
jgi:hypothetical protein